VLALAAAAVVAGGYVAQRLGRADDASFAAISVPRPMPRLNPSAGFAAPRNDRPADVEVRDPTPPAVVPSSSVAAAPSKVATVTRVAQKRVVEPPPAPSVPAVPRFGSAPEPESPGPAPAPVIAPPVPEAPPPDRWQVMADSISRCGREGFFAGVICEQRVRIKYCEGYWGQAAQCPSGISNDHGR
jgi:hypothetical protein